LALLVRLAVSASGIQVPASTLDSGPGWAAQVVVVRLSPRRRRRDDVTT
jgi:hypothetical protein